MWGKKKNKSQKHPDLFDDSQSGETHIEQKTARSMRRVVYTEEQRRKIANDNAQKKLVSEYIAKRDLLANEYLRERPDYSKVFDYGNDGMSLLHRDISEEIRSWVRHGLYKGMTYAQIKNIVVGEFRLHKENSNKKT
jgi:hypothetical protein